MAATCCFIRSHFRHARLLSVPAESYMNEDGMAYEPDQRAANDISMFLQKLRLDFDHFSGGIMHGQRFVIE